MWPSTLLGNAERVSPRQAAPENDVAVAVMKDQNGMRYFRFRFGPNYSHQNEESAVQAAKEYARLMVGEGMTFVAGHVGYISERGNDYTGMKVWSL
jgi:hypothetical protein